MRRVQCSSAFAEIEAAEGGVDALTERSCDDRRRCRCKRPRGENVSRPCDADKLGCDQGGAQFRHTALGIDRPARGRDDGSFEEFDKLALRFGIGGGTSQQGRHGDARARTIPRRHEVANDALSDRYLRRATAGGRRIRVDCRNVVERGDVDRGFKKRPFRFEIMKDQRRIHVREGPNGAYRDPVVAVFSKSRRRLRADRLGNVGDSRSTASLSLQGRSNVGIFSNSSSDELLPVTACGNGFVACRVRSLCLGCARCGTCVDAIRHTCRTAHAVERPLERPDFWIDFQAAHADLALCDLHRVAIETRKCPERLGVCAESLFGILEALRADQFRRDLLAQSQRARVVATLSTAAPKRMRCAVFRHTWLPIDLRPEFHAAEFVEGSEESASRIKSSISVRTRLSTVRERIGERNPQTNADWAALPAPRACRGHSERDDVCARELAAALLGRCTAIAYS